MNISQHSSFSLIDNVIAYFWLFTNEEAAIEFAHQNGVIYNQMRCENCEIDMHTYRDSSKGFGYKRLCTKCHKSKSILFGSICYSAKLPISKNFNLLYCWVYQISFNNTSREVGVNKNTVTYYFTLFRNACDAYVLSLDGLAIGGPGKAVQIDETLVCRRKYHVGCCLNEVWIFGGMCVEMNLT